jgi:hypothetical protein
MKAISVWEPWASLIRTRAKTIETRSWSVNYRGKLLICAGKRKLSKQKLWELLCIPEFKKGLLPIAGRSRNVSGGLSAEDLYFGHAVAVVELYHCKPTNECTNDDIGFNRPFGDFSFGRYAWFLRLIDGSFKPFRVKGRQGLFNIDDSLIHL